MEKGFGITFKILKTMKRPQNIEHPDLTTMFDDKLELEAKYFYSHSRKLCGILSINIVELQKGWHFTPSMSKSIEDLKFSIQRFEAIIEEMNYRAQMMR